MGDLMSSGTAQDNLWLRMIAENPDHSKWYIKRFRDMAERGDDLAGEARMIDAMVPRGSRVLDAGCGTGRVGGFLASAGHRVTGVDLDPELIAAARTDRPDATWLVGDLAQLDLPDKYDIIVCAGNVMTFLAPSTRSEVLRRFAAHLADGGRAVIGFGAGRGYEFHDFFEDAAAAGLRPDVLLSTWDLRAFHPGADFLVALLAKDR
jgi:SAM-dependent methyltransferase